SIQDTIEQKMGRMIYEEFTTVVILKEQIRVTDVGWRTFLTHLRNGRVEDSDVAMLKDFMISDGKGPDYTEDAWRDMCLVTPRHAVRTEWNQEAIRKHCKDNGQRLYVSHAEDTTSGRPLTLRNDMQWLQESQRKEKGGRVICQKQYTGAKVLVTQNIETDLDIANGTRAEIVDIILDEREPAIDDNAIVVELKYPPAGILVKLKKTR
ncbi:hypothetical protein BDZ89DRAFT_936211, partial [Hymenopellis radicata]